MVCFELMRGYNKHLYSFVGSHMLYSFVGSHMLLGVPQYSFSSSTDLKKKGVISFNPSYREGTVKIGCSRCLRKGVMSNLTSAH